jgi:hypothetical protein
MMPLIPNVFTPFLLGIGILEAAGLGAMLWTATRKRAVEPENPHPGGPHRRAPPALERHRSTIG